MSDERNYTAKLDSLVEAGLLSSPPINEPLPNCDYAAAKNYCREKGIDFKDLTKEEWSRFIVGYFIIDEQGNCDNLSKEEITAFGL